MTVGVSAGLVSPLPGSWIGMIGRFNEEDRLMKSPDRPQHPVASFVRWQIKKFLKLVDDCR